MSEITATQRRKRAQHGLHAVQVGTPDYDRNDDVTNAVDTIANVLLWLAWRGYGDQAEHVLDTATYHYEAERA